jgi:hypothetical protein
MAQAKSPVGSPWFIGFAIGVDLYFRRCRTDRSQGWQYVRSLRSAILREREDNPR